MLVKVLNLYAGIGGNRALWSDCVVTAVEYDPAIAEVYKKRFPADTVIVADAHEYLEKHFSEFDFIWSSPPCPTHSQYRHNVGVLGKGFSPVLPDMRLYSEIIFLQTYFKGAFVVENVKPYYTPLIPAVKIQRHLFWSNYRIPAAAFPKTAIGTKNKISDFEGFELVQNSGIKNKRQVLRNCVDPDVGAYVFTEALKKEVK